MGQPSATSGFVWKILEQFGIIGVQFVLQIVLARVLSPSDYGEIAIVSIFISLANIFVQCGLSTALVQKKELDRDDVSSIFNYSVIVGLLLYAILYVSAPWIGSFFRMPNLSQLLRVMALTIFPGLFNAIQIALIRRQLRFKIIFFSSMTSVLLSGILGIYLAYAGSGAWALVWQMISYNLLVCLTLFVGIRWLPRPILNITRIKPLVSYGWKILLANLIDEICLNIRSFVIGKQYSSADLAFFNRGKSFPDLIVRSINGSLQAVLLPVLSKEQNNDARIKELVRRTISISTFVVFPVLAILASSASTFIPLLLTDKWSPAVLYLQIFCIYYMSWPITTSNIQAMYAKGLSGKVLHLEAIRKTVDIAVLFISMAFGIKAIAWGVAIVSVLSIPLYLFPSHRILDYQISDQLKDISPSLLLAIISGALVWGIGLLEFPLILKFSCQVVVGLASYLSIAALFNLRSFSYFKSYLATIIPKRFYAKTNQSGL